MELNLTKILIVIAIIAIVIFIIKSMIRIAVIVGIAFAIYYLYTNFIKKKK